MNRIVVFISGMLLCFSVQASFWPEDVKVHGFATQNFFHTSDNNVYGQSDDGISPGLTEIGLNLSYQPLSHLTLSIQGLYRRAGKVDGGNVRVDYGVADLNLFNYQNGRIGIRGGRIKIPFGLYGETRDVAFTNPTVVLPQGIYFDRSRSLLVSADGGSFYADHQSDYGDLSFKFNLGVPLGDNEEIRSAILGPSALGQFDANPAIATQLSYEMYGGQAIFAVSYMDLKLEYKPRAGDVFSAGHANIRPLLFSAQYNGEKFGLTAEYLYRWNKRRGFSVLPNSSFVTESWYLQGSYRLLPQLQAIVRYDTYSSNIDDRAGNNAVKVGLPAHLAYAKDWMVGLRWDVLPSVMLRTEYHRVHGTAWIANADNRDISQTKQDWDLYIVQLSYRF